MLKLDSLPEATLLVFEHLAANPSLCDFTLIGGTALALQIGHRWSEDLDFWLPAERMDKSLISSVVRAMQNEGFDAKLATPHEQIVAEKNNGRDLLAHAQDYVIGGVKVTFFARADIAYNHFNSFGRIGEKDCTFSIMSEEGLFSMKSYVIHQRVRSRDLYDLKTFMTRDKTLDDIFSAAIAADPACSAEYAKAVLLGDVPLDKEDEGFDSIGITETIQDLYAFFLSAVNDYEQSIAENIIRGGEKNSPQ